MAANKCFHTKACTKSTPTVWQGQSNGAATRSPHVLSTPNELLDTTAGTQNHKLLIAFSGFCFFPPWAHLCHRNTVMWFTGQSRRCSDTDNLVFLYAPLNGKTSFPATGRSRRFSNLCRLENRKNAAAQETIPHIQCMIYGCQKKDLCFLLCLLSDTLVVHCRFLQTSVRW